MSSPETWQFVTAGATACPCTLFESDATPANSSANDSSSVTLGVQFTPDTNGWITGVRFYKGAGNTGTHIGDLWTSSGALLAEAHVHQRNGDRMADRAIPDAGGRHRWHDVCRWVLCPERALRRGFRLLLQRREQLTAACPPASAGVYAYGNNKFPSGTYAGDNYWVDPIFTTQGTEPGFHAVPMLDLAGSSAPATPQPTTRTRSSSA